MTRFNPQSFDANYFSTRLGIGLGVAIAVLLFLLLLKLLLPWLLLLAGVWAIWYYWQRQKRFQERLYTCFYECLQTYQGRISVLDFAIAAHITGPQARAFLDARAKDFFADFEPTAYGDVLYTFRRPEKAPQSNSPKLLG